MTRSDDDEYEDEDCEETLYDPEIPTVFGGNDEDEIVIDTGIVDEFGDPIYRVEYREPMGFRYWEQLET